MPYCANCGSQVEGRFCPSCGAPVAGAVPPNVPIQPSPAAGTGLQENVAAALCYVLTFITGIIFLVLEPYNKNKTIRFHAFQAIFLGAAWFALWFVLNIIFVAMRLAGAFFALTIAPLIGVCFFFLWLYMIIAAYQGKKVELPIIGPLAKQQA